MFRRKPQPQPISTEKILNLLNAVQDPQTGKGIVDLNMVHDVQIEDGNVEFTVAVADPKYPYQKVVDRESRLTLMGADGVKGVKVNWMVNTPASAPTEAVQENEPTIIAVASGKGGVGKSTVAVNLSVALAETGASVGLLDADIYGPNCNIMMGVERPRPSQVKKMAPAENYGVKIMSMGFLVKPDQPLVWRGPMLHSAIREFLQEVEWGELDYLVIDLPPGTGDAQLSLAQTTSLTGGVIVTLPQEVSQADARRGLEMFNQLNVPIIGVVENMSYLALPNGEKMDVFGAGGGKALADAAGVDYIGGIPMDPNVRIGGDAGKPIMVSQPTSEAANAMRQIALDVAARADALKGDQPDAIQIEVIE